MEQPNTKNPGKIMSLVGTIMALISGIGGIGILFIAVGWASFEGGFGGALGLAAGWTFFTGAGMLLSFMGRKKSKMSGNKTGLGTTAIVGNILAMCLSIFIILAVFRTDSDLKKEINAKKVEADSVAPAMKDEAQHMIDSMNAANDAASGATDTTKK